MKNSKVTCHLCPSGCGNNNVYSQIVLDDLKAFYKSGKSNVTVNSICNGLCLHIIVRMLQPLLNIYISMGCVVPTFQLFAFLDVKH